ncbi:MAG: CHAT domain-containing protein [Armatimonadetes bacterium]|nr:CHAT domain-containing protein [Armatimonadota bacterium]
MQATLPEGWTQAEYAWLSALGQARDPARLLDQHRDWQRAAWVQAKLDALQGLTPDAMQRLTPAVQGLIRLADRLGALELRCYARERRLDFALALYDLRGVSPVMRELAGLLPRASSVRQVNGWRALAGLYRVLGELAQAQQAAQRAYTAAQRLGDPTLIGQCEYMLALLAHTAGDTDSALRWVQRARANAQRANQLRGVAECYTFEGVVRRARGEYDQALAAYRAGIQASEQADFPLGVARCIANTGLVYWTMGLYEDARLHYREAMTRFQQLGAEWDVATCTLNTAILLQHDGDYEGALELYAQAQRRYEALGDTEGVAYCLLNRAAVYDDMRQHDRAVQTAHQAATLFDRLQIPLQAVQARQLKANALLQVDQPRNARLTLDAAQRLLETLPNPTLAVHQAYLLGEAHGKLGAFRAARRQFEACLRLIRETPALRDAPPEEVGVYLSQFREIVASIAGYYGRAGDWRAAFDACQQGKGNALRLAWNAPLSLPELTRAERGRLDALRQRYETALSRQSRARTPAEIRQRRRETERALLAWRAYQRTLAARYPRLNWQQPEPLRPEQLPLDEQTLLIEYAVAPDWLTIVWARRQGGRTQLGGQVVRVPAETLRAEIQALLEAVESEASPPTVQARARALYERLIRPLEAQLQGVRRVMVCPDGDLHSAPWAVLCDSRGRYLLERTAIASCPSASAWASAERLARPKPPPRRMLVAAVSEFRGAGGDTRARLSPLPGALREANAVQRVWGSPVQALRNQQATRAGLTRALTQADVLHLATHATPNLRMPMLSAIALWGESEPQWLYAHEVLQQRLRARLTTLSACQTAVGATTADGALGLHWAFLAAGCPTVLATLWRLPDAVAPVWSERFYARYKAGAPALTAMREACLAVRRTPQFQHPRYWGAWQCFGATA